MKIEHEVKCTEQENKLGKSLNKYDFKKPVQNSQTSIIYFKKF